MGNHEKAQATNILTKQTSKGVSASLLLAAASVLGTSVGVPAAVSDGSLGLAANNAADQKSFVSTDGGPQQRVAVQQVAVNLKVTTPTVHTYRANDIHAGNFAPQTHTLVQPRMKSTVKPHKSQPK